MSSDWNVRTRVFEDSQIFFEKPGNSRMRMRAASGFENMRG